MPSLIRLPAALMGAFAESAMAARPAVVVSLSKDFICFVPSGDGMTDIDIICLLLRKLPLQIGVLDSILAISSGAHVPHINFTWVIPAMTVWHRCGIWWAARFYIGISAIEYSCYAPLKLIGPLKLLSSGYPTCVSSLMGVATDEQQQVGDGTPGTRQGLIGNGL